ncbi:DNA repair protein RecO [Candidatus Gracilibacteria bacterium]|nr:DNA repair protein RecO [Candidatus Gracilibacteria bacterium]
MKNLSTKAIILGHKNIGENDKFIFLYTEEFGKLRVVAKGARKITSKFTGHLETLNICNISLYFGPKTTILRETETIRCSLRSHQNLEKIKSALQIAEITEQVLFERQSLQNLLALLEHSIIQLESSDKPGLISIAYLIKLLDLMGILPDLSQTKTSLKEKYQKFFQYVQTHPLAELTNIALSPTEEKDLKFILQGIIEKETEHKVSSFF